MPFINLPPLPTVEVRLTFKDMSGQSFCQSFSSGLLSQKEMLGAVTFGSVHVPTYTDRKHSVVVLRAQKTDTYEILAKQFAADLTRKGYMVGENAKAAELFFEKTLDLIKELPPCEGVVVGLAAASKSIYFRFYHPGNYKTHLEVFYTKDDEEDNIEAVTTVYENKTVVLKQFGALKEVFDHLRSILPASYLKTATSIHGLSSAFGTAANEPLYQ